MNTKNYIKFTGGIVRIHAAKTITSICIATDGGGGPTAFPVVTFYNSEDLLGNYKIGDRVTIEAHAQLRIRRDELGNAEYFQDYVGDSIEKTERLLAAYIEDDNISKYDGGVKPDENIALIFGKVHHVYAPNDNVTVLSISLPRESGGRSNRCEVACFRRQAAIAKMLNVGDCIMIAGSVRTRPETTNNGRTKTIQNIISKDIVKVDDFDNIDSAV